MQGPLSTAALAKSLAMARTVATELAKATVGSQLESPGRDASQAPVGGSCSESRSCDTVTLSSDALRLSREEEAALRELQGRDADVRSHENAHAGAGGAAAGAPSFVYEQGPDGRQYATSGEVPISVKRGATPEETFRSATQVRAAALAPSDPSPADLDVAARASALEMDARREMARGAEEAGAVSATEEPEASGGLAEWNEAEEADAASPDPRALAYTAAPAESVDPVLVDLFG